MNVRVAVALMAVAFAATVPTSARQTAEPTAPPRTVPKQSVKTAKTVRPVGKVFLNGGEVSADQERRIVTQDGRVILIGKDGKVSVDGKPAKVVRRSFTSGTKEQRIVRQARPAAAEKSPTGGKNQ